MNLPSISFEVLLRQMKEGLPVHLLGLLWERRDNVVTIAPDLGAELPHLAVEAIEPVLVLTRVGEVVASAC